MKKTLLLAALFAALTATAQRVDETDTIQISGRLTLRDVMVDSVSVFIPTSGQTHREVPTDKAVANYVASSVSTAIPTAGTGISVTGTAPPVIANTGDLSTTNEIQTLSRTSTNNTASLSLSGGSVTIEDVMEVQTFSTTASGTTVTLTGTLPTDVSKYVVERGGLPQNYGTAKGVVSIVPGTGVVTFTRPFLAGEVIIVRFPKQ